jgi:uncharacterized phage-associated protein
MTFSPIHIGNNIIRRARTEHVDVSTMKLQKLLFFTAAEFAKITGGPLLHERFRVWPYGPVAQSLHDKFGPLGGKPLSALGKDAEGNAFIADEAEHPEVVYAIGRVWRLGRDMSGVELARLTQSPGSAWHQAFTTGATSIDDAALPDDFTYRDRLGIS